jgi:hypothetical protein
MLSFFSSHVVDLTAGVVLLPLRSRLASCSRSGQLVGTLSGEILVAGSAVAAVAHLVGSSTTVFTATEHLVSASGTMAVSSKIGGAAFASVSVFSSSAVA